MFYSTSTEPGSAEDSACLLSSPAKARTSSAAEYTSVTNSEINNVEPAGVGCVLFLFWRLVRPVEIFPLYYSLGWCNKHYFKFVCLGLRSVRLRTVNKRAEIFCESL